VLRAWPELIPLPLLERFGPTLKTRVAIERGLPNTTQIYELPRDDGGPPLLLFKPLSRFTLRFRDEGTVPTMTLDEQGFCNPTPNAYSLPTIDIIAIGDSFTWCQSLPPEAVWSVQLAKLLDRTSYNLGRGRIGPYEYLQILQHFGLKKYPQVVILNIYEGNDLRDALRYARYVSGHTSYMSVEDAAAPAPVDGRLSRSSYLYNLLRAAFVRDDDLGGEADERGSFRYTLRFPSQHVRFNRSNTDRDEITLARALANGEVRLDVFDAALARFVELSRQHSFVPVVSFSPSAYSAYADFVEFQDPRLTDLMSGYDRAMRDYFAAGASRFGYRFVDETPALRAAARELGPDRLLYFPYNLHFTPEGHRVVAELLAREIAPLFGELPGSAALPATGSSVQEGTR